MYMNPPAVNPCKILITNHHIYSNQ
jgi:hypothetical protein